MLFSYRGDAITRFIKTCVGKTDCTPYWAPESGTMQAGHHIETITRCLRQIAEEEMR